MMKCYLCDEELTAENDSDEHIFLSCIGGRLKISSLLCKICNKTTGHLYDSHFAKIGNFFASKNNIKRDRGYVQNFTATELNSGKKLIIEPGFKISYAEPKRGYDNKMVYAEHRDKKRAIAELHKIIKELKFTNVDTNELYIEKVNNKEKEIQFIFDESIEPDLILRSVCKSIINLYIYKTADYHNCQPIIQFLRDEVENRFSWFLDLNISKEVHNNAPYHTIIIKGEKRNKLLYAYFEMFGEVGFLVLLNGGYTGEDQQINYTYDPINAVKIVTDYIFKLQSKDIIEHLIYKPEVGIIKCFHH